MAWRLIAYFKSHAQRFYAKGRAVPVPDDARAILTWAKAKGRGSFTNRDLGDNVNKLFRKDPARLAAALEWLGGKGAIRPVKFVREPGKPGRSPAPTWAVNPLVLSEDILR